MVRVRRHRFADLGLRGRGTARRSRGQKGDPQGERAAVGQGRHSQTGGIDVFSNVHNRSSGDSQLKTDYRTLSS